LLGLRSVAPQEDSHRLVSSTTSAINTVNNFMCSFVSCLQLLSSALRDSIWAVLGCVLYILNKKEVQL